MAGSVVCMAEEKSPYNAALGAEIRAWRGRKGGMSRRVLAELSGINEVQIERLENNKRDMSVTQLFDLARGLGIDPDEVVRTAIAATGGLDQLFSESADIAEANGMVRSLSVAHGTNVTPIKKSNHQLTAEDIDAGNDEKAADEIDAESDQEEPDQP